MKIKFIFTIILFLTLFSLFSLNVLAEGEKQQNWASSYINNSPLNYCLGLITSLFISSTDISFAFSPILTVHLGLSSIPLEFIEGVGFGIGFEASNSVKPQIGFTALFQLNYYLAKTNGMFFQISMISGFMNWGFGIFFNSTGGKK